MAELDLGELMTTMGFFGIVGHQQWVALPMYDQQRLEPKMSAVAPKVLLVEPLEMLSVSQWSAPELYYIRFQFRRTLAFGRHC